MAASAEGNNVAVEICKVLGLDKVVNLDIKLHFGDVASVTVLYYPDEKNLRKITPILAKYRLIPIKEKKKDD